MHTMEHKSGTAAGEREKAIHDALAMLAGQLPKGGRITLGIPGRRAVIIDDAGSSVSEGVQWLLSDQGC